MRLSGKVESRLRAKKIEMYTFLLQGCQLHKDHRWVFNETLVAQL